MATSPTSDFELAVKEYEDVEREILRCPSIIASVPSSFHRALQAGHDSRNESLKQAFGKGLKAKRSET